MQRQLKGNLILSCQKPKHRIQSIIKTDDQLGNNSISDHCIELVKQKYNVEIPEGDIFKHVTGSKMDRYGSRYGKEARLQPGIDFWQE